MAAYYDEKQKSWYVKFRYTDWQGNSKSTSKRGFKTKKEALKYEQEAKESLKEIPKLSLRKFSEEYLEDYKSTNKRNSYVLTEKNVRKYIRTTAPCFNCKILVNTTFYFFLVTEHIYKFTKKIKICWS